MTRPLLLVVCLWSVSSMALLVDGTAARVGKNLITVQDAQFFRAVHRLAENNGDPLKLESGEEMRRTVQKMVFEDMVLAEMTAFKFQEGGREEAEKIFREKRGTRGAVWNRIAKRFGRSESSAVDVLYRGLQAERFVQRKVETLTPVVTDAEVERYYVQTYGKGGPKEAKAARGSDFEQLKPKITLLIKKERMQKGLEEWVRFLRDKYGVTTYLTAG